MPSIVGVTPLTLLVCGLLLLVSCATRFRFLVLEGLQISHLSSSASELVGTGTSAPRSPAG